MKKYMKVVFSMKLERDKLSFIKQYNSSTSSWGSRSNNHSITGRVISPELVPSSIAATTMSPSLLLSIKNHEYKSKLWAEYKQALSVYKKK
uniref:Uncharacterized protein n=1 Tax=Megaselia scalaris TaxID=36166 RepID=T1GAJ3_MEGSC